MGLSTCPVDNVELTYLGDGAWLCTKPTEGCTKVYHRDALEQTA